MYTYPRYKTNASCYDEIYISELPFTNTNLSSNNNNNNNNNVNNNNTILRNYKYSFSTYNNSNNNRNLNSSNINSNNNSVYCSKNVNKIDRYYLKLLKSINNNENINMNEKYKILFKYYHDRETRKKLLNNDYNNEVIKKFEHLKENYFKQKQQPQAKLSSIEYSLDFDSKKKDSINSSSGNDTNISNSSGTSSSSSDENLNNHNITSNNNFFCYCQYNNQNIGILNNNNKNNNSNADYLSKSSSNSTIASNITISSINTSVSTSTSNSSIESTTSTHSYFSIKSEYCCNQCEHLSADSSAFLNDNQIIMDTANVKQFNNNNLNSTPSSSTSASVSSSPIQNVNFNNNDFNFDNQEDLVQANTKRSSDPLQHQKSQKRTSNATLDQLLKSLDDINLYLERNLIEVNSLKQKKQLNNQPLTGLNVSSSSNNLKALYTKKYSESINELKLIKNTKSYPTNTHTSITNQLSSPATVTSSILPPTPTSTSTFNRNNLSLTKYSYLNLNKNRHRKQQQSTTSIEMSKAADKPDFAAPILSSTPIPQETSNNNNNKNNALSIENLTNESNNKSLNLQITRIKSCSHDMLNNMNNIMYFDNGVNNIDNQKISNVNNDVIQTGSNIEIMLQTPSSLSCANLDKTASVSTNNVNEQQQTNDKISKTSSLLVIKDQENDEKLVKSQKQKSQYLSPTQKPIIQSQQQQSNTINTKRFIKKPVSPITTTPSLNSSLASSLAKLNNNSSTTTPTSGYNTQKSTSSITSSSSPTSKTSPTTVITPLGVFDSALTVELLFRDLMLDCDDSIKKLDEIENARKTYKLKQQVILSTIEIKTLMSIYKINKSKLIKKRIKKTIKKQNRRVNFNTSIKRKKLKLSKKCIKSLIIKNSKLKYINSNNNKHLLIINKSNKIPLLLNRLLYRFKLNNTENNKFKHFLFNLFIFSYYLNYNLMIDLNNYKIVNKIKKRKQLLPTGQHGINVLKVENVKKKQEKFVTGVKYDHKSLLDEFYDKYCAITTSSSSSLNSMQSLKRKKRSRTEERLDLISKPQAFLLNDCLKMKNLEFELVEACKWLINAGFKNYVEMFEKDKFPINLTFVNFSNSHLNDQELKAVLRRLEVLNKCSEMCFDYSYIKNDYANPDDEDDDEGNDKENRYIDPNNITITEAMLNNRKKQQLNAENAIIEDGVLLRKILNNQPQQQQHLQSNTKLKSNINRFYSFQNQTNNKLNRNYYRNKLLLNARNRQYANDNNYDNDADNDDDESDENVFITKTKTYSLQPNAFDFFTVKNARTVSNLLSIDNYNFYNNKNVNKPATSNNENQVNHSKNSSSSSSHTSTIISLPSSPKSTSSSTSDGYHSTLTTNKTPSPVITRFDSKVKSNDNMNYLTTPAQQQSLVTSSVTNLNAANVIITSINNIDKISNKKSLNSVKIENIEKTQKDSVKSGNNLDTKKDCYTIDDNNINLAIVKLTSSSNKRKNIPDNQLVSVYDNIKNSNNLKHEKHGNELDDMVINANNLATSSPSYSTSTSSHQLSQSINEENAKITFSIDLVDSETLLPKLNFKQKHDDHDEYCYHGHDDDEDDVDNQHVLNKPERRDSGVERSLTRANIKKYSREKWHSFVQSHSYNNTKISSKLHLTLMNAKQYSVLKPFALVRITALMEEYSQTCQKSGWNRFRAVPKFIKKHQRSMSENNIKNKSVFGVPFKMNVKRHGQPLPQAIIQIMKHLRTYSKNTTGVFRKSGAKSRMNAIRDVIEKTLVYIPDIESYKNISSGQESQAKISNDIIDAADLLKQYFRELPECLLTNKLSQTLIDIFTCVPQELRLEAVQYCMLLLDDENRNVLQCLLYFLHDIAEYHDITKMDVRNIAICLAPTLLNMNSLKDFGTTSAPLGSVTSSSQSFTSIRSSPSSNQNSNLPSPTNISTSFNMSVQSKDPTQLINKQCNASLECLSLMIENPEQIFQVPNEAQEKINLSAYVYKEPNMLKNRLNSVSVATLNDDLEKIYDEMLKEIKEKSRNWNSLNNDSNIEIYYKKIDDAHPIRLWKLCVEFEVPADTIFQRLYFDRPTWDDDLIDFKIIDKIDEQIDIIQYEMHIMPPQVSRTYCELRSYRKASQLRSKYAYAIYSTSIEHSSLEKTKSNDIVAVTLRNFYLIEAIDNKCRLYQLYRGDYRGYSQEWYNKMQGHVLKRSLLNLKQSF